MIRAALAGVLLAGSPAAAASWATKDVCTVSELSIPASVRSDPTFGSLAARAEDVPNGVGRLWQIESSEGAVSHLFGTLHVNDLTLLELPPELDAVLETTRLIAPEMDRRLTSRRFATYDPNDSLRWRSARASNVASPFEPELENWLRTFFSGYGLTEPWTFMTDGALLELLLWDPCNDFNAGIFPIMDDQVMLRALLNGADVFALEEPTDLLRDLSTSARAEATSALLQVYGAYTQPAEDSRDRQTSYTLYAQGRLGHMMVGDAAYLAEVFGDERGSAFLQASNDYLIGERNERWLDRIEGELTKGGVTMSVGAFHLPGEEGLVALLRARGFKVTRLVAKGEVLR